MQKLLPCGRSRPQTPLTTSNRSDEWRAILGQYLKVQGLRATQQREQVAEIALSHDHHFEIQNLIREVQGKYPEISPATVYRSVKTLCDAGLLTESLQSGGGVALYEPFDEGHHDHVVCLDCGEIFEFHNENLEKAQTKAVSELNFKDVKHKHVIYANCNFKSKK